jgi:hypothetical protein
LSSVFDRDFPDRPPYVFNFTGDVGNNTLYPSVGRKAHLIKYGESVEIVFQGTNIGNAENHPMHLHGFSFYLVGTGYGNFDNVTSPKTFNLKDPPEVNTIGVPKNGWAVIRFVADNPGTNLSLSLSLSLSLFLSLSLSLSLSDMMAMLFQGFGLCTAIWNGMRVGVWTLFSLWRMGPPMKPAFGHPRLICLLVLSSEMLVLQRSILSTMSMHRTSFKLSFV